VESFSSFAVDAWIRRCRLRQDQTQTHYVTLTYPIVLRGKKAHPSSGAGASCTGRMYKDWTKSSSSMRVFKDEVRGLKNVETLILFYKRRKFLHSLLLYRY
jgi:hypothetical protein